MGGAIFLAIFRPACCRKCISLQWAVPGGGGVIGLGRRGREGWLWAKNMAHKDGNKKDIFTKESCVFFWIARQCISYLDTANVVYWSIHILPRFVWSSPNFTFLSQTNSHSWAPASKLMPAASAFRHQGQSGTAGPALPSYSLCSYSPPPPVNFIVLALWFYRHSRA